MRQIVHIACLSLLESLHRKVLLGAAFGLMLVLLPLLPALEQFPATGLYEPWWTVELLTDCIIGVAILSSVLALVLGAGGISSAERTGLMAGIIAGPVARGTFLVGRMLGLIAVPAGFVVVGMSIAVYLLLQLGMESTAAFWWGLAEVSILPLWVGAMAVALNTRFRPLVAAGLPAAVVLLRATARQLLDHPALAVRALAALVHYAAPAQLPGAPLSRGLRGEPMPVDTSVCVLVLLDNLLYGVAAVVFGAWALSRKDIRSGER